MRGLAGDTLASALLANGAAHCRAQPEIPSAARHRDERTGGALRPGRVLGPNGREPNRLATTLELREGLEVESQNRWPSLRFDALAINDLFARFLPAGFYYKTFMAPGRAWERIYEPLLRRAAGLGRLRAGANTPQAPAETVHDHLDVLVVGAGAAGLAAAQRLGLRGLRVLLVDEDAVLGGGSLLDDRWTCWREAACKASAGLASVRCLTRTAVIGAYGHGVYGALETLTPAESARAGGLCERLRVVRARAAILATGAIERLIAFPGNDVPGVMLAGAAHKFLRRYGVAVGRRPGVLSQFGRSLRSACMPMPRPALAPRRRSTCARPSPGAERARALGRRGHHRGDGRSGARATARCARCAWPPRRSRGPQARGRLSADVRRIHPEHLARQPAACRIAMA